MLLSDGGHSSRRSRDLVARLRHKHLLLIATLSRTGNIGRAATELNMTQSAASKILQDAEDIFGAPLFDRQARGLLPTVGGEAVIAFAQRGLNQAVKIANDVEGLSAGGAGSVAIGAIMASTPDILPAALATLRERRPLLTVHLTVAPSDQLLELLDQERIEVGLCRLTNPGQCARFKFEPAFEESYWIVIGQGHPLARSAGVTLPALAGLPWVVQPEGSPSRFVLERVFAGENLALPLARVETTSHLAALELVRHSGMVSLLPSTVVVEKVQQGLLIRLDPCGVLRPATRFGLVTRRNELQTSHAAAFCTIIRNIAHG